MDRLQLYFYDSIGDWDGPSAQSVANQILSYRQADGVDVYLNSLGGDVFEGMAIYNVLVRSGLDVVTHVDGAALSIASVIAQAGRERRVARGGLLMVHEPAWWLGYANIQEMEAQMKPLAALRESIADVYAARTGQPSADWLARMTETTWYSGAQAVAAGLADTIVDVGVDGRHVDGQLITSQALNHARALQTGTPAGDRPAMQLAARIVTPTRRALVVNAGIPAPTPFFPISAAETRTVTMKLKDWLNKQLGDLPDVDVDVQDDAEAPAADPAIEAAPENKATAPVAPVEGDTPLHIAVNALTKTVGALADRFEGIQSERVAQAKNDYVALFDQKVKTFAVNEADRETMMKRFDDLGGEVATQLLNERADGALRPGGVRAPQNRSTAPAGGLVTLSADEARDPVAYRAARAKAKETGGRVVVAD